MIQSVNHYGGLWADLFGIAVLQNTVFLLIVILALHIFRKAPARIKFGISLIGFLKLLFPPFLQAPFPFSRPTLIGDIGMAYASGEAASLVPGQSIRLDGFGLLFIFWIVVSSSFIVVRVLSTIRLKFRLKHAETVTSEIKERFVGQTAVTLRKSDQIDMPMTIGINPKTILVPSHWDHWSADCRNATVSHELAHIKRKDGIVQALQILTQALYFFHPLVWFLSRRLDEYREMACDDSAVSVGKCSSVEYSRCLVEIAENMVHNRLGCSSASALIRRKHELLNRVKYQVMEVKMKQSSKLRQAMILLGLFLLFIPLSWYCGNKEPTKQVEKAASAPALKTLEEVEMEMKTDSVDVMPKAIRRTAPQYPESAQKAGLEGTLFCYVRINENGDVVEVKLKGSVSPDCDKATIDALKTWKFTPAQYKGKPVAIWLVIPFNFKMK